MRRTVALLLPVLLTAVLPALPASAAPEPPPSAQGWSVAGDAIEWTAPAPIPLSDAGVEFWEGDRFLGAARESANLRTFTLNAKLTNLATVADLAKKNNLKIAVLDLRPKDRPFYQLQP